MRKTLTIDGIKIVTEFIITDQEPGRYFMRSTKYNVWLYDDNYDALLEDFEWILKDKVRIYTHTSLDELPPEERKYWRRYRKLLDKGLNID